MKLLVFAVLLSLSVPLQLPTRQPLAGLAVRVLGSPARYLSGAQPVEWSLAIGSLPEPVCVRVRV